MTTTAQGPKAGRRAARRAATRRRIVEAAVELHTTVGVAATTISAIARRAGVQRHTVYAHFPDDRVLLEACTALWEERNPPPDVGAWLRVADPGARLRTALDELYGYWERSGRDLAAVFSGAEADPALAPLLARRDAWFEAMAAALARGWGARGRRRARLLAALRHAVRLDTWRSLTGDGAIPRADAVAMMAALVEEAARGPRQMRAGARKRASATQ